MFRLCDYKPTETKAKAIPRSVFYWPVTHPNTDSQTQINSLAAQKRRHLVNIHALIGNAAHSSTCQHSTVQFSRTIHHTALVSIDFQHYQFLSVAAFPFL